MQVELNPLLVVGGINKKTPICIIKTLCKILSIEFRNKYSYREDYLKSIRTSIESSSFKTVSYPCSNNDELYDCVKFFNIEDTWNIKNINISLETYFPFFDGNLSSLTGFNISLKSNDNPTGLSDLQVYRLCKYISYNVCNQTTVEEMFFAVDKYYSDSLLGLKLSLIESIKNMNSSDVIKLTYEYSNSDNKYGEERESPRTCSLSKPETVPLETVDNLSNSSYLLTRIIPRSSNEAIYIAHKRWNIYIGNSNNPLLQFKFLLSYGKENYIPVGDGVFASLYLMNKRWFDTSINWFPCLISTYSKKELKDICIKEGLIDTSDLRFNKGFLEDRFKICNIYFDIVPHLELRHTYLNMDPVNELDEVLTIGKIETQEFYYFTIDELCQYFTYERMFIDPYSRKILDSLSITKLKNYCSEKNKNVHKNLLNVISMIERSMHIFDSNILDMKTLCFSNEQYKADLKTAFEKIIELGLTMRGSKTKNFIPLSSLKSGYTPDKEALIYQQSYDVYCEYKNMNLSNEVRKFLDNINIITFSSGTKEIFFGTKVKKSIPNHSLKLNECMSITFLKDHDIQSCVRSNSNWILYTGCWYMKIFCFELNFEMDEIEEIL